VIALAAAAALALPAATAAQDTFIVGAGDGAVVRQTAVPVTIEGALTVDFHSDPASCEAAGRCGLTGTVSWRPPRRGSLFVVESRRNGRRHVDAYLFAGTFQVGESGALVTVARVQRTGAAGSGLCADGNADAAAVEFESTPGAVDVGLAPSDATPQLLATRCAGPLLSDVRAALPSRRLSVAAIRRGRLAVDLHREAPFAAAGLAGTVRSDLVLRLGRGKTERADRDRSPRGVKQTRQRSLEATYRVERLAGDVGVDVRGAADPAVCGSLDACGLQGTDTLTSRLRRGTVSFYATAPAKRPRRELRAALGLAPGGRGPGIVVLGSGIVEDRGDASVTIGRPGEPACTDHVPLQATALFFDVRGTTVRAVYSAYGSGTSALRSRCPGPPLDKSLAEATVPLRAFGAPRVTLRLRTGVAFGSDGYTARSKPDVTVVLRRTRLRESVQRLPDLGLGGG
jgi:hypothetical protein